MLAQKDHAVISVTSKLIAGITAIFSYPLHTFSFILGIVFTVFAYVVYYSILRDLLEKGYCWLKKLLKK